MKNSTLALLAAILLILPFLVLVISACIAVSCEIDFEDTVLGSLIHDKS